MEALEEREEALELTFHVIDVSGSEKAFPVHFKALVRLWMRVSTRRNKRFRA